MFLKFILGVVSISKALIVIQNLLFLDVVSISWFNWYVDNENIDSHVILIRCLHVLYETSYVGVGKNEDVQLFYYFVESIRNPEEDPLIFYVPGGPGASALITFLYEIGTFFC